MLASAGADMNTQNKVRVAAHSDCWIWFGVTEGDVLYSGEGQHCMEVYGITMEKR